PDHLSVIGAVRRLEESSVADHGDIVRLYREAEGFLVTLVTLRKLRGEAEGLDLLLGDFHAVEEVGDFRLEADAACRVEARIVNPLMANVKRVFDPFTPRESSVLRGKIAVLAFLLDDAKVVVFHAATHNDARDLCDRFGDTFAGFELAIKDYGKVCAFFGFDRFFDAFDFHFLYWIFASSDLFNRFGSDLVAF
ncbi:MAG: hypothetical protein EB120_04360, partial [Proteobacteria bacterium]|nr:hypothetical protein [Pseudomonadota bacterium]